MSKRLKQCSLIAAVVIVAAQFVRPSHANPPVAAAHALHAYAGTTGALAPILERACGDCHSNRTTWPWYTQVAPLSWLMSYSVKEGRGILNISEWASYSAAKRRALLAASCRAVSDGKMPGSAWTTLHPEARLSKQEIQTICAAAQSKETTDAQ